MSFSWFLGGQENKEETRLRIDAYLMFMFAMVNDNVSLGLFYVLARFHMMLESSAVVILPARSCLLGIVRAITFAFDCCYSRHIWKLEKLFRFFCFSKTFSIPFLGSHPFLTSNLMRNTLKFLRSLGHISARWRGQARRRSWPCHDRLFRTWRAPPWKASQRERTRSASMDQEKSQPSS